MVTRKGVLVLLGVVGSVVSIALAYTLWSGLAGLYAAQRAQIFDEPARAIFVSAALSLLFVPVIAAVAYAAFALAGASSPLRRALTAWGLSIVVAPALGVAGLVLSMVLPTPDFTTVFFLLLVAYAVICGGLWVAVARARFGSVRPSTPRPGSA